MWGLFPLYWPLLKPIGALEILSHRVVWSLIVVVGMLFVTRNLGWMRHTSRTKLAWLTLAAVLVSFNWLLYIWAVNTGHVVETSLGYFINPLISVLLGVTFLKERLRPAQWFSLAGAFIAVLVLSYDYGHPPWIALGLAPSFALYGLVKKRAGVGAVESLSFETGVLTLPAIAYLVMLEVQGTGSFGHVPLGRELLLIGAGVMTALPLVAFGASANRVPLSTLGLLQYFAPTLQFMCGVLVFHEQMSDLRWVGFGLIWLSLIAFAAEGFLNASRAAAALPR
jgi:chloramphenicol-sensitive protein RarD